MADPISIKQSDIRLKLILSWHQTDVLSYPFLPNLGVVYSGAEKDQGEQCCGSHLMTSNELCDWTRYNPVTKRMPHDDKICYEIDQWTSLPVGDDVNSYNSQSQVCLTLKDLMPITFSSPMAQPEVVQFLISNESPYFSSCKSKISASNSL